MGEAYSPEAMDHTRYSTLAHHDHVFCNPLSDAKVDRLIGLLDLNPGARVIDVGCGKGEMLIRIAERWPAHVTGVDTNASFLDEARARARRVHAERVVFHLGAMKDFDAAPESFDAGLCIGASHAFGTYRDALRGLRRLLRPGGLALVGDGYWRRAPAPEYLALLGATPDEMADHAGNVAAAVEEGFTPLYSCTAGEDDWDHYEGLYARAIERFVAAHPDDPDAEEMRTRIRLWRDGYLKWGRGTLGFACTCSGSSVPRPASSHAFSSRRGDATRVVRGRTGR